MAEKMDLWKGKSIDFSTISPQSLNFNIPKLHYHIVLKVSFHALTLLFMFSHTVDKRK